MKTLLNLAWMGIAMAALGGCGGESESSGGSSSAVDTGLAESILLRDVTSAQAVTACENIRGAIQEQVGADQTVLKTCELLGAALTDTPDACQTQTETCVTQTNEGNNTFFTREQLDFAATLECDGDTSIYADCDVSVGELESCMAARLTQVQELFANFACSAAATIGVSDAQMYISQLGNREAPAACQRLATECPRAEPFSSDAAQ